MQALQREKPVPMPSCHFLPSPPADNLRINVHKFSLPLPTPLPYLRAFHGFFLASIFQEREFYFNSLAYWLMKPPDLLLALLGGPSPEDADEALSTPGSGCSAQIMCSSSPEHFTWLIQVGRDTGYKSPKFQGSTRKPLEAGG